MPLMDESFLQFVNMYAYREHPNRELYLAHPIMADTLIHA
jgi:hypothetical protein